jgi:hypothetical protein
MGHRRSAGVVPFALAIGFATAARAGAAPADPLAGGLLEGMSVPAVTVVDATDGRVVRPPFAVNPIAVPTPTAAESGGVVLLGLIVWRATRRVIGRA